MKKTPLHQRHVDLGARMVDFGGWHMPVQYSGLAQEHQATRTKAGLFDVSHMGEVLVEGGGAENFLNALVTNNVSKLVDGQAQYTVMCQEDGGVIDDLLVYRRGAGRYLLCVNASNADKDFAWIEKVAAPFPDVKVKNVSDEFCQIAIQGPEAVGILQTLAVGDLSKIKYYHFSEQPFLGKSCILSRTGYTGEDGFEIYAPANLAVKIWDSLLEAGAAKGLVPCGLGARDTLRTEMKFPLYGHEITDRTLPLEAGLGWVVKLDKANFVGREALLRAKNSGLSRHLVGLRLFEKAIARQDYEIYTADGATLLGKVTSGTLSPTLNYPIAIGYVNAPHHAVGTKISVKIRDRLYTAEIVATPFYKRAH